MFSMIGCYRLLFEQLSTNKEINDITKIVGLDYKLKYDNLEDMKKLRYGKVIIINIISC